MSTQITGVDLTNEMDAIQNAVPQVTSDIIVVKDADDKEEDEDNDGTDVSPPMGGRHDEDSDSKNQDKDEVPPVLPPYSRPIPRVS